MLESLIEWLDAYILDRDAPAIIKSAIGLLGFASLLGAVFGSEAVRIVGVSIVALLFLVAVLALLGDRRRLHDDSDTQRKLLRRYCDFIMNDNKPIVQIVEWKQTVDVTREGDVTEYVNLRAIVLRKELYFLRLRIGAGWAQPPRYRKKVKVRVRSLDVNGTAKGPKWNTTVSWLEDGRLHLIAHLHDPVQQGRQINIEMKRVWPGKCLPLMRQGGADIFTFRFDKLMPMESVSYEVKLPVGCDAYYEAIGFEEPHGQMKIERKGRGDAVSICFSAAKIPLDRKVGMRLELR